MKNLGSLQESLVKPLHIILDHHPIIVVVLMLSAMIFTVFTVNAIISQPSDDAYRSEQELTRVRTNFDTDTIEKIERLGARQDNNPLILPSGRINPFSE